MTRFRADVARPDALFAVAVVLVLVTVASSIRSVALIPAALFAAVIVFDRAWTLMVLSRLTMELEARRTAVSVGEPVEVVAQLNRVWPLTRVQVGTINELTTTVNGRAAFTIRPTAVGLIDEIEVAIRVLGLGITSSTRQRRFELRARLHCGPRLDVATDDVDRSTAGGSSATRAYAPGDRPNRINWSATARTGTLLVRSAGFDDGELVVVVDSTTADTDDFDWLHRPGSTIASWWRHHDGDVRLVTLELEERGNGTRLVDAPVHDRDDLLRRLARVRPGPVDAAGYPDALRFAPEEPAG